MGKNYQIEIEPGSYFRHGFADPPPPSITEPDSEELEEEPEASA